MNNEFDKELKYIEEELLKIKTASEYTSIKNASVFSNLRVTTGLYRITYKASDNPIIAMVYKGIPGNYGRYYLRTPSGNTQIVEVVTTYWSNADQRYYTDENTLTIISNTPVESIEKL